MMSFPTEDVRLFVNLNDATTSVAKLTSFDSTASDDEVLLRMRSSNASISASPTVVVVPPPLFSPPRPLLLRDPSPHIIDQMCRNSPGSFCIAPSPRPGVVSASPHNTLPPTRSSVAAVAACNQAPFFQFLHASAHAQPSSSISLHRPQAIPNPGN
jgi:hypothetical protein